MDFPNKFKCLIRFLFLIWAVPEFRDPTFAYNYYDHWQAYAEPEDNNQNQKDHFWVGKLYGLVFAEDSLAQWVMSIAAIAATVVSLLALIWVRGAWREAKRSADAANKQLALAYPPRLVVAAFAIWRDGADDFEPPDMVPGTAIKGWVRFIPEDKDTHY